MADHDAAQLFVIATNGYDRSGVGAEIPIDEGLLGVAARRRRQVRVTNVERARTLATATRQAGDSDDIALPGLDDAQSVVATPLLLHDRLFGVLYLDSEHPGRFGAGASRLIEVLAGHLATTLTLLEAGGLEPLAPAGPAERPTIAPGVPAVAFYDQDGSVLVDGDYVIKGVPGRILYALLAEHQRTGRTEFTNREIRFDRSIGLPSGNDNLEARLLTLRRRLADRDDPFAVERIGRGQLRLTVSSPLDLVHHDDPRR